MAAKCTVLENGLVASDIYRMVLHGGVAAHIERPGQFVHVRCGEEWETLLRRPLSIAEWSREEESVTLIYRAQGKGTQWLAGRVPGDKADVLGPLGSGFPLPDKIENRLLIIGGGVGVPPLYGLAHELRKRGAALDICLGFTSRSHAFYVKEFQRLGRVRIATDDGSLGQEGHVVSLLKSAASWEAFYACGPLPMLAAVKQFFAGSGIQGYVSLEQRMGCGIGACLACVWPTPSAAEHVKVCRDGPVFDYEEVVL